MPVSPSQPSSVYRPDKFIGLLPASTTGAPTSFVGAYIYDASTGQAIDLTRILASSAVAVPLTGTGSDSETVLATITIPAGAMGLNGRVRVTTSWSNNNSGGNKTARVRFGGASGTIYFASTVTTTLSLRDQREIMNRGAADSQVGGFPTGGSAFGTAASAPVTSSVDTSAATTIVISGQLAVTTDTLTLESYLVELIVP